MYIFSHGVEKMVERFNEKFIFSESYYISSYPDVLALKKFDGRKLNLVSHNRNFKASSL